MKLRTRYSFLALGILFFLIAAPVIVFYVGGINYDADNNRYMQTGILSVKTEPKEATLLLDEQINDETTPVNLRFMSPKEYVVTLKKDGYWEWSKRLEVKAGKATIASGALDRIYLLKKNPPIVNLGSSVIDYYVSGEDVIYLTPASISLVEEMNPSKLQVMPNTRSYNRMTPSSSGRLALLFGNQGTAVLNKNDWSLTDISSKVANLTKLTVTDDGLVLGLEQKTLVRIENDTKLSTTLTDVTSYYVLGNNLYYIQKAGDQARLALLPISFNESEGQVISATLPAAIIEAQILVTDQKDIVLHSGTTLYKVNTALDLIADNVTQVHFEANSSTLVYATAADLSWYEFFTNKSHLITRNAAGLRNPQISYGTGYAFYIQDRTVQALELDNRDRQNNYQLLEGVTPAKITLSGDHRSMLVLDNGTLKRLPLR
jgi:hypothetical protein